MPTRRHVMTAVALGLLLPRAGQAAVEIGRTLQVDGRGVVLRQDAAALALVPDLGLAEGDLVTMGPGSTAALELFSRTRINLGAEATFRIDAFAADQGGTITVNGPMVFDRPEDLAPMDLSVQVAFAQIGVRGTQFFAGPSNEVQSVFVRRGRVVIHAAGATAVLNTGEGVELPGADQPPGPVVSWGEARITAAFASAGVNLAR
jgi:ferric-dicitrate binding protein FerR (iron transport regulator)